MVYFIKFLPLSAMPLDFLELGFPLKYCTGDTNFIMNGFSVKETYLNQQQKFKKYNTIIMHTVVN